MHSKTPLLPFYKNSEERSAESQTSCSPPSSICSTLSSVIVDSKDDSSPSPLGSTPPADKKHVKFVDDLGHICRPEPWSGEIDCNNRNPRYPHRPSYGAISYHSILKEPTACWSKKIGREKTWHGYSNGSNECRSLRTRIRLRSGFSPAEISHRQKLSPLVYLLGSFTVMVILFIWFLSGGDSHFHKHRDFEAVVEAMIPSE